jgi:hypothetical protein
MKKTIFFLGITIIMITACNQPKRTSQVLEDDSQRQEIMQTIANDKEMITEMSKIMMKSENAKMMMMQNQEMISMMMGNRERMQQNPRMIMGKMMTGEQIDSTMRIRMSGMMERSMMISMMQSMQDKGIMSPECMKANMENLDKMENDSLK